MRPSPARLGRRSSRTSPSLSATVTSARLPAAGAASGAAEFGRTVMIGVPVVTFECTMVEPPKMDWVATKSSEIPTASVITPLLILIASRPAISLPSAVEVINTAAGDFGDQLREQFGLGSNHVSGEFGSIGHVDVLRAVFGQRGSRIVDTVTDEHR